MHMNIQRPATRRPKWPITRKIRGRLESAVRTSRSQPREALLRFGAHFELHAQAWSWVRREINLENPCLDGATRKDRRIAAANRCMYPISLDSAAATCVGMARMLHGTLPCAAGPPAAFLRAVCVF